MSTEIQTIYAGEGAQDVEVYPVDAQGQLALATGATVRIVDLSLPDTDDDRIILAETAATIDSTSTAITAAAGEREADPRKIVVTSASGITVGRRYALSNSGRMEVIEVDRIEGLNVYSTAPLTSTTSFPATTTDLIGLRVSGEFPAAVANASTQFVDADGDEVYKTFGVDWTFVGVTGPTVVRTLARIERRGKLPRASRWDVLRIDPQIQQAQHSRGTIEAALAQADEEVDALLVLDGWSLADATHGKVASMAVRWRAVELIYQSLGDDHTGRADRAGAQAQRWLDMLRSGTRPADAVEVARSTDAKRGRRTRLGRISGG